MTYLIGIAGVSGSGKTTLAEVINAHLNAWEMSSFVLSTDNCYKDLSYLSTNERDQMCFNPDFNFDHPRAVDVDRFLHYARRLKKGEGFRIPVYDFKKHLYGGKRIVVPEGLDVGIIEGIHTLCRVPPFEDQVFELYDHTIFVVTTPQIAQLRRIRRDIKERGRDIDHVSRQLQATVIPMQERYVLPCQMDANDIVDWRVDETDPKEIKKKLMRIGRQKALAIYELLKEPLLEQLDPEEVIGKIG